MENIKINSFLDFKFPSAPAFSPDGKLAAFVVQTPSFEKNTYVGDIWILNVQTEEVRQLTAGGDAKSFYWTEKGTVLFPAARDPEKKDCTCFYEIAPHGGEAKLAFTVPVKGASLYLVDEDRFIVRAPYQNRVKDGNRTDADCDVLEETPFWSNGLSGYTDGRRTHLYLYTLSADTLTPISDPWFNTSGCNLRGNQLLYKGLRWQNSKSNATLSELWLYDLETGENRQVQKAGTLYNDAFALWDGGEAIVSCYDDVAVNRQGYPDFYRMDLATGELTLLAKLGAYASGSSIGSDARLGGGKVNKVVGDRYYFLTTEGDGSYLKYVDKTGFVSEPLTPDGSADSFDVSGENILVCGMFGQTLPELYLNGKQVTNLNTAWYEEHTVVTPEFHSFINDGYDIHGWAMKPADYVPGKQYPAIVHIHGGPRTAFSDIYHHEMQVWANAGYFVLFCNPRGSDGRGSEFGFIQGLYGTVEYENIMAFTDEMLKKYPEIDPNRLGVAGGSYGGFMTNWVIGHTDRFAAAVSQRGIADWVSFEHTSDIGYYFTYGQQGATTAENAEKLWEKSPLKYAHTCTTPTLFIHADEDYRCPIADGYAMFTALKKAGCDAKMVVFHGENHELSRSGKPRNRIRRMEEILGWMDKYLKTEETP